MNNNQINGQKNNKEAYCPNPDDFSACHMNEEEIEEMLNQLEAAT